MKPSTLINKFNLAKTLTGLDLFCIATGAMISSGIFILPGVAFKQIGPAVFLSYGFAGIAAMIGALAVIELSTAMPKAGGTYYFIERSLGPGIGTVSGILSWLALVLKTSFAAYGLGAVLSDMFGLNLVLVASVSTIFFLVVNLIGTKEAAVLEVLMVFALLYTPCIAALATIHRESRSWKWTGLCVVFQFAVAWIAAVLIFQAGSLFLGG